MSSPPSDAAFPGHRSPWPDERRAAGDPDQPAGPAPSAGAFPSYEDWIAGHSDAVIAGLILSRQHAAGGLRLDVGAHPSDATPGAPGFGSSLLHPAPGAAGAEWASLLPCATGLAPSPADGYGTGYRVQPPLEHLSAAELLVLHAAVECGATQSPQTVATILATCATLLDATGTSPHRRPSTAALRRTLGDLAAQGLVYGPQARLAGADAPNTDSPAADTPGADTPGADASDADKLGGVAADTDVVETNTTGADPHLPLDGWELRVPGALADTFDAETDEPWALSDHHRCPIPTPELPRVIEALPSRQRRLLSTLEASGGIGHSQSLHPDADPDAPLPTLVRSGILDQLDDTTARLSGRVAQYLRGTVPSHPGGDFHPVTTAAADAPRDPVPPATAPGSNAQALAGSLQEDSAHVVHTLIDLGVAVQDALDTPLPPLSLGGIGLRELSRAGRRRGISTEAATASLTLAHQCGLLGCLTTPETEHEDPRWTATPTGRAFLRADLPHRWAIALTHWLTSPYAPWDAERRAARPFTPTLNEPLVARVRRMVPLLVPRDEALPSGEDSTLGTQGSTAVSKPPSTDDPSVGFTPAALWRVCPFVASHTTAEAWDHIAEEAVTLGILARCASGEGYRPTAVLFALADYLRAVPSPTSTGAPDALERLARSLATALPAPTDTLIAQSDHTLMAPGLLPGATFAQVQGFADAETLGVASVWRVSPTSLRRAYAHGETAEGIRELLAAFVPGGLAGVPQSLLYVVDDEYRRAVSQHSVPSATDAARDAAGADSLTPATPADVDLPEQDVPEQDAPEQDVPSATGPDAPELGAPNPLGTDPLPAPAGLQKPALPTRETHPEVFEAVDAFREARAARAEEDAAAPTPAASVAGTTVPSPTPPATEPRAILALIRRARVADKLVRLRYVDSNGQPLTQCVQIVLVNPSAVVAVSESDGRTVSVAPHRITSAELA